jgi:hypothetical protein
MSRTQLFWNFVPTGNCSEKMIADATKEDLAEVARILAMQAAHFERKYGELPKLVCPCGIPARRDRPPAGVDAGNRSQRAEGHPEAASVTTPPCPSITRLNLRSRSWLFS